MQDFVGHVVVEAVVVEGLVANRAHHAVHMKVESKGFGKVSRDLFAKIRRKIRNLVSEKKPIKI